eukprot:scaffold64481_cov55-Phaeocystis_antarctica.AAC.1
MEQVSVRQAGPTPRQKSASFHDGKRSRHDPRYGFTRKPGRRARSRLPVVEAEVLGVHVEQRRRRREHDVLVAARARQEPLEDKRARLPLGRVESGLLLAVARGERGGGDGLHLEPVRREAHVARVHEVVYRGRCGTRASATRPRDRAGSTRASAAASRRRVAAACTACRVRGRDRVRVEVRVGVGRVRLRAGLGVRVRVRVRACRARRSARRAPGSGSCPPTAPRCARRGRPEEGRTQGPGSGSGQAQAQAQG